ncbi:MAG: MoaD/ThiS family protein [Thermoplasmata archaeon]|nr:MoaD/ThiS family protein [Thermoplasmata archaeon]
MPSIKVEFYGAFRDYAREVMLSLPEGATVEAVVAEIARKLPELHWKIVSTETTIVVVNGQRVEKCRVLEDGDVVKFFSSVLGG